jgi:cyclopropane-fatty-acyl-phospholipid synthase
MSVSSSHRSNFRAAQSASPPASTESRPTGKSADTPGESSAWYTPFLERGLLPDWAIRAAARHILRERLREESAGGEAAQRVRFEQFITQLKSGPIAVHADAANAQHYEVPADFFGTVLGKHLKYSCGYWPAGVRTLDASEEAMLALTAERARVGNGQNILELGCGWGSLSLYLAERFPGCRITGVSNSRTQKEFIDARARSHGLTNLEIITADMNTFDAGRQFDRVVSVEMFEHMRNYRELLARVARWM